MSCQDEKLQVRTHLSKLLINDSKLEVVADNMLIKRDNEPGCLSRGEEYTFSGFGGYSPVRNRRGRAYFWVEDGVKSVHVHFFTDKLQSTRLIGNL